MIPKPRRDDKGRVQGEFYPLQKPELIALRKSKLINNAGFVHLALRSENPFCNALGDQLCWYRPITVIPKEFAIARQIPESSVYEAIAKLRAAGVLPEWVRLQKAEYTDIERQIRDRLKLELGGEVEVVTAVGHIDLLTATEVIEIKNINNWKEALGKILAYSALFPEHQKRIHLFGNQDLSKLALAQATYSEFGITVTFEEAKE
jgi:hypothetical protein